MEFIDWEGRQQVVAAKPRLRRVTFAVFAQFLRQHTMSVLLNF
jgi:hypothetical protein